MTKIARYNGNLKAFASEALGTERTIFGETTQANDLTSQITADFLRGWGIVGPSDEPSIEDFNGVLYAISQLVAYIHQVGIPEYNSAQEYYTNSFVSSGGDIYKSLLNANVGNDPATNPLSWANISGLATTLKAGLVQLATNAQMAAGTSTTLVPSVAAVMSLFSKRSFSATDFIRIPDVDGGLIIQWFPLVPSSGAQTISFPTPFPSICTFAIGQLNSTSDADFGYIHTQAISKTQIRFVTRNGSGGLQALPLQCIAIGA